MFSGWCPAKGIVYFDLDKEYQIKVVNVLGEEILSKQLNITENTIDLTEFSDGIYYIKFYNDKFIETKKIILE